MKRHKVGYTTGVYDMFHVGHLNLLKRAKEQCDFLIVGVTSDELVSYKNKKAIIPHQERMEIVESISYVDMVVPQIHMDKMEAWEKYSFDVMFVGDDWKGTEKWNKFEDDFRKVGVEIVYFPYTKGTSSSMLREVLSKISAGAVVSG
ncbi:adenylyltransferase/cytidyltransferase family protein [Sutcliffiella halmapala]|uniref:adenylyltransferase/cytidyltransferase family protein n=1 Tax=Sutcliffiella halmapala TaxID=79882 RepID=UPI0009959FF0|nr:adenylyltransferase/cytidyltransferase family protein [Sutcliffiella halmapala]